MLLELTFVKHLEYYWYWYFKEMFVQKIYVLEGVTQEKWG